MPDPIAKSRTADNKTLLLWEDGLVTFGFGFRITGIGASKNPDAKAANLAAGWWLMGDACLYDAAEAANIIKVARKLARSNPSARPGDFRALLRQVPA